MFLSSLFVPPVPAADAASAGRGISGSRGAAKAPAGAFLAGLKGSLSTLGATERLRPAGSTVADGSGDDALQAQLADRIASLLNAGVTLATILGQLSAPSKGAARTLPDTGGGEPSDAAGPPGRTNAERAAALAARLRQTADGATRVTQGTGQPIRSIAGHDLDAEQAGEGPAPTTRDILAAAIAALDAAASAQSQAASAAVSGAAAAGRDLSHRTGAADAAARGRRSHAAVDSAPTGNASDRAAAGLSPSAHRHGSSPTAAAASAPAVSAASAAAPDASVLVSTGAPGTAAGLVAASGLAAGIASLAARQSAGAPTTGGAPTASGASVPTVDGPPGAVAVPGGLTADVPDVALLQQAGNGAGEGSSLLGRILGRAVRADALRAPAPTFGASAPAAAGATGTASGSSSTSRAGASSSGTARSGAASGSAGAASAAASSVTAPASTAASSSGAASAASLGTAGTAGSGSLDRTASVLSAALDAALAVASGANGGAGGASAAGPASDASSRPDGDAASTVDPSGQPASAAAAGLAVAPGTHAAAAPGALPSPAAPAVDPNAVIEQLLRGVSVRLTDGTSQIRLRLVPEHLGDVTVQLVVNAGRVDATLGASTAAARDALAGAQTQLARALSDAGLRLQGFTVGLGGGTYGGARDGGAQDRWASPNPRRVGGVRALEPVADDPLDAAAPLAAPASRLAAPGAFDLLA